MRSKRQEMSRIIDTMVYRSIKDVAFDYPKYTELLRDIHETLRDRITSKLYEDYIWLELCDVMAWKRRRVLDPPADKE